MRHLLKWRLFRGLVFFAPALALTACVKQPGVVIASKPADPVIAKVAVPVPCEVTQIPRSEDPATRARKGDDVFTLAKIAAASRRVLLGENAELRAANTEPCG